MEAITACQDAATIYRETGDRNGVGGALNNLGAESTHAGQGRWTCRLFSGCQDGHDV